MKRGISLNGEEGEGAAGAWRAADAQPDVARLPSSPSKKSSLPVLSYLPSLLKASLVTITLSCLAMALAVVLGVAIASGRVYGNRALRH